MASASTVTSSEDTQKVEDALTQLIAQINEIREQMKADDLEIRQSNAEYALLKAESQTLRKQTNHILANVRSIL